nr:2-oxoglutarate-Fe(II) type oxidoreductase hxnY-like [Ziziphus jujuba var. spinosa]
MKEVPKLPIIDLSSPDLLSTANSLRQACIEYGFFYVVNHGVEEELTGKVFEESNKFFSLPLEDKMKLFRKEDRGYTPLFGEILHPYSAPKGDSKEIFYVGPLEDISSPVKLNKWPSQQILPSWRATMESFYKKVFSVGKRLLSLIALALDLNEDYFEKARKLDRPTAFLRLLRYPGRFGDSGEEIYGASAHSDYGMITLLVSNGVRGLQVCRDKSKEARVWEDVVHINGAFIVNIGDMMERWTNCLFRSTLHRVMLSGQERYSVAFFLDPNEDYVVQCIESCCSESSPPRFPPIRSGDYLKEHFKLTFGS